MSWHSTSIMNNNVGVDMLHEYVAVFSRFEPDEGVELLDRYADRVYGIGSKNRIDYEYSLAMFMQKRGLLTEKVGSRVLDMIERGVGLEYYNHSPTWRRKREKALAQLEERLRSPQPERKKLRLAWNITPVFEVGDVVSYQLATAKYPYFENEQFTEEEYLAYDGWWIMLRKVRDDVGIRSKVLPELADIWPVFDLYDYLGEQPPAPGDIARHRVVLRIFSDGRMGAYKRCNVRVVENCRDGLKEREAGTGHGLFTSSVGDLLRRIKGYVPPVSEEDMRKVISDKLKELADRQKIL